jgi:SH3 domain-containing YSC84-like protein 1
MLLVMRTLVIGLILIGFTLSAGATTKADLDKRLRLLSAKFEEMQAKPEKRISADNLRKACGIVLLQSARGGLVFGYQGGNGVVMTKDPRTGGWSAPAFVSANEGTFGLQIGGQTSFTVILLMNTNTAQALTQPDFQFGGEASGTAGNASSSERGTMSQVEQLTLVYNDTSGLYGGAVLKGGGLAPDSAADVTYYGEYITAKEILFDNKVKPTEAATSLIEKLNRYSQ